MSHSNKDLEKVYADMPNEVIWFKIQAGYGMGVSVQTYDRMLETYPEYFPEEVKYRDIWKSIPDEVKDAYFEEIKHPWHETEVEGLGKAPYPELIGLGILKRVEHYDKPNAEEIEKKYRLNEMWQSQVARLRHQKEIEAYNKHFNIYGLKK